MLSFLKHIYTISMKSHKLLSHFLFVNSDEKSERIQEFVCQVMSDLGANTQFHDVQSLYAKPMVGKKYISQQIVLGLTRHFKMVIGKGNWSKSNQMEVSKMEF